MISLDVPASLARADVVAAVEKLCFPIKDLVSIEFHVHGVYATYYARDGRGISLDTDEAATHRVFIPIAREDGAP